MDLPPSDPFPFRGSPWRVGFLTSTAALDARSGGLPWVRRMAWPISRPAPRWFGLPRISGLASHARSTSSPTPFSRFAVRYVHGFCLMLPSDTPFRLMPLPCWRCPSVRLRWVLYFRPFRRKIGQCAMPGAQRSRSACGYAAGWCAGAYSTLLPGLTPGAIHYDTWLPNFIIPSLLLYSPWYFRSVVGRSTLKPQQKEEMPWENSTTK